MSSKPPLVRFAAVAAAASLSGCASVQSQPPKYATGSFPKLQERTTSSVGQAMVSSYDYLSHVAATLRADVPGGFWSGRAGMAAGTKLVGAVANGVQVYCFGSTQMGSPCFRDTDNDGAFDEASVFNAYGFLVNNQRIPAAPYKLENQTIVDGFKYELIYQGVDNGVVRVAYREFTENLARPAFSQDLTYTLSAQGDTVARFRDVSMKIHSADNNEIAYTVTSGFASQAR